MEKNSRPLSEIVTLAGWTTPQTSDGSGGGQAKRTVGRSNLNDFAMLARLRDSGGKPIGCSLGPGGWEIHQASGQLNVAHSRWLMGVPAAWDEIAIMAHREMQAREKERAIASKPNPRRKRA